jgi:hypothetical protein
MSCTEYPIGFILLYMTVDPFLAMAVLDCHPSLLLPIDRAVFPLTPILLLDYISFLTV